MELWCSLCESDIKWLLCLVFTMVFLLSFQIWFKNARAKRRRLVHLQKMAYTVHDVQRWKRRRTLRRSLNGSPAVTDNLHPMESCHLTADQQHPPQQILSDHVTPFSKSVTIPCLETPTQVFATPMPRDRTDWVCYAPVPDLPPDMFVAKATAAITCPASQVCERNKAFHDSSFKRLFGKLFDSLLKEDRMI